MPTQAIIEIPSEQVAVLSSHDVWKSVARRVTVPESFSGKYVQAVAVVTSAALDDTQEAQLKAAIEAIAGVDFAHILVGSSRLSHDRLPTDTAETTYDLQVVIQMGIDGIATEVTP